jgi:hypothetical protein
MWTAAHSLLTLAQGGAECLTSCADHFIPGGKLQTPIELDAKLAPEPVRAFWTTK